MDNIQWTAPEYIHREKTADWYWIVGIVGISATIVSIILNNVIFAILIIVSTFTLSLYASRPPKKIEIEISKTGIRVGGLYYPYEHIESFWVEMNDAYPRIILKSQKKIMLYIVILIESVDPGVVRAFLAEHLQETPHSEPLLEKLLIYLGF